jgi:hypothetical protein
LAFSRSSIKQLCGHHVLFTSRGVLTAAMFSWQHLLQEKVLEASPLVSNPSLFYYCHITNRNIYMISSFPLL